MDINKIYYPEIKKSFFEILSSSPNAYRVIDKIGENSELLLFGGCIRDYLDNKFTDIPRDFDIVLSGINLDLEKIFEENSCYFRRNKFGGYKVEVDNLKFDFWEIQNTWAFKERKVEYRELFDLRKTVFLNVDGIIYDLNQGILLDEGYSNAIQKKEIDIVLKDNPYPELNLARALRYKYKYKLGFSKQLQQYFNNWLNEYDNKTNAMNELQAIEMKRYSTSIIDWTHEKSYT